MNRRSFLKKLGLLVAVPFVPTIAIKHLLPSPDINYKCYRSNAETFSELCSEIRIARKDNLLQRRYVPRNNKVCSVVSLKDRNWGNILSKIKPQARYVDVGLARKGFDNFFASGIPILSRS